MFSRETELSTLSEIVSRTNPEKRHKNQYQYYKERKDGWVLSVVCNQATREYEVGLFEVGLWQRVGNETIVIADTQCSFDEVAKYEKDFDKNPAKLYMKYSV